MSLYSCSLPSSSSSSKESKSSNSYRLLSSSSSITTVSSQLDNNETRGYLTTDDEQWPAPPVEQTEMNWRIEKNISLTHRPAIHQSCILKAVMTKEQILVCDSSSTNSTIIPGKHLSMKVVFKF